MIKNPTPIPRKGDTHTFSRTLKPYRLYQNRPFDCRPSCRCGDCNGQYEALELTVDEVIYWADNSIEAFATDPQSGRKLISRLVAPHGDACY